MSANNQPNLTLNGAAPLPANPAAAPSPRRCQPLPRGMLRRREAAVWSGVSLRTWASWESAGLVPRPTARIGSVVLYSIRILRIWRDLGCPDRRTFEALSSDAQSSPTTVRRLRPTD
jgi:hypothetical protein